MDNYGLFAGDTVSREKVLLERCLATLPRDVLSEQCAAGY